MEKEPHSPWEFSLIVDHQGNQIKARVLVDNDAFITVYGRY